MKSNLLTAWALLIFIALASCNQTPKRHIGTWEGKKNSGQPISLTLYDDNVLKLVENDKIICSKEEQNTDGKSIRCEYQINYKETPMQLDFILFVDGEKKPFYKNAINFLNDSEMEMVSAEEGAIRLNKIDKERPEYALLKKVK